MQHLLDKYTEEAVNNERVLNTAEKRLCRLLYQTKAEQANLMGQASKYITVMIKNEKYIPVFDSRYEKDVAALYARIEELDRRADDLITRIDKISREFTTDIHGYHQERRNVEKRIEQMALFPSEQDALRKRHEELGVLIDDYTKLLGDI